MSYQEIEKLIGRDLPESLKKYLDSLDNEMLSPSYSFPVKEPSPFGEAVIECAFLPTLDYLNNDEFFEMGMLCIGNNLFGNGIYLSVREKDFGYVYYWDHDYRCFWDDETFYKMFPNLAGEIVDYLGKRKNGQVPTKEEDYESFYLAAETFEEFIEIMKPQEY